MDNTEQLETASGIDRLKLELERYKLEQFGLNSYLLERIKLCGGTVSFSEEKQILSFPKSFLIEGNSTTEIELNKDNRFDYLSTDSNGKISVMVIDMQHLEKVEYKYQASPDVVAVMSGVSKRVAEIG